ncbi:YpmS family protein [Alkalicoccobacillus porphyridii]|nr:YpmS family protein [Alkalicoccobacillus porphyridii]
MNEKRNYWKVAFISLVAVCVCLIIAFILMVRVYLPEAEPSHYTPQPAGGEQALLHINSSREQLNQLIAEASLDVEEETPYTVEVLANGIEFRSTFPILGQSVPITVQFIPEVAENGDLLLEAESFSFGLFNIPSEQAMQLMSNVADLPDWIIIHPSESLIEVNISEARFNDRYSFRIQQFDLENDQIDIEMFVND